MAAYRCNVCKVDWPAEKVAREQQSVVGSSVAVCPACGDRVSYAIGFTPSDAADLFKAWYRGWDRRREGLSPEEEVSAWFRRQLEGIQALEEAA